MSHPWTGEFEERMRRFERGRDGSGIALSVKVRVTSGCFHREHSPRAYRIIDEHVTAQDQEDVPGEILEHESGPELLVYFALGAAVVTLVKSVVDLVVVILKARSRGIEQGDHPHDPLEIVVRRSVNKDSVKDECIVRLGYRDRVDEEELERRITDAVRRLSGPGEPPNPAS